MHPAMFVVNMLRTSALLLFCTYIYVVSAALWCGCYTDFSSQLYSVKVVYENFCLCNTNIRAELIRGLFSIFVFFTRVILHSPTSAPLSLSCFLSIFHFPSSLYSVPILHFHSTQIKWKSLLY